MDQAIQTMIGWFNAAVAAVLLVFALIERFLHALLDQLGVPERLQSAIVLVAVVLVLFAILRLFGGVLRVLLAVFLILLLAHVLAPIFGF